MLDGLVVCTVVSADLVLVVGEQLLLLANVALVVVVVVCADCVISDSGLVQVATTIRADVVVREREVAEVDGVAVWVAFGVVQETRRSVDSFRRREDIVVVVCVEDLVEKKVILSLKGSVAFLGSRPFPLVVEKIDVEVGNAGLFVNKSVFVG